MFETMIDLTGSSGDYEMISTFCLGLRSRYTLICELYDMFDILAQYLQRPQFFLLIFSDWLLRYQLRRHARSDELIIVFCDLNPALFGVKLAYPHAVSRLLEIELLRLILRKLHHIEPCNAGTLFAMRSQNLWGAIEESLEFLEKHRSQWPRPKIARHALMPMQNAIVILNK